MNFKQSKQNKIKVNPKSQKIQAFELFLNKHIMFLCNLLSDQAQPGTYAYEAFKKVPQLSVLIQAMNVLKDGGQGGLTGNIGNVANIANMAGNTFGVNPFNNGGQHGRNSSIGGISGVISQFVNNVPEDSMKANNSNMEKIVEANQDGVIKKIMKSNYSQLVKKHAEIDEKFIDPDFPPEKQSIGNIDDLPINASWKRISQVMKNPEFVSDQIQPSDILQGSIGDCYFLSAVSALAENDFRIKSLFPDLKMNSHGIYMARILYQGVLTEVVVDDYIPVNFQGAPLFAKPAGGKQIWVMILEKCWAKLHGSYGAIVGGLPNQVLHAFSGAPTFYRPVPKNKEKQQMLWRQVSNAHKNEGVLCCGTKGQSSVEKAGLVQGHAYTIIDVYEQPKRLLKIRNPWGNKQWNGRASEQDTHFWASISAQDKRRINYKNGNDGVFFMLWEDFVNYFDMVDICKIKDNANYLNVDCEFDKKNGEMFEFELTEGTHSNMTVSLSQQSLRGFGEDEERRGYSRSTLMVAKHDEASKGYEYKYVDSSSSQLFSNHNLELQNLPKGKYVIFAKYDWIRDNPDDASISIYTEAPATLKLSNQSKHKQFIFKTLLDHARKNQKKQTISEEPKQWICSDFLLGKGGYGYLAIHLDAKATKKIGIELNQKQYIEKRLFLKKPYKGQGTIKTMVEPGKQLIIPFRMKAHNYPTSITLPTPKIFNLTE